MTTLVKRMTFAAFVTVAGAYAFIHLSGPQGIPALLHKRELIRKYEDENDALRKENERRRQRNEILRTNPDAQELEIRQGLRKLRKGEKEFYYPPAAPPAAPAR